MTRQKSNEPTHLVMLTDGRVGLGFKTKYKGRVCYIVDGIGFYIDDIRKEDIIEAVPIPQCFKCLRKGSETCTKSGN